MSDTENKSATPQSQTPSNVLTSIQPPALQVTRMLRSPSHESVTTELSLLCVSSIASDAKCGNRLISFKSYSDAHLSGRVPSPNPDSRGLSHGTRPADIPEILWFEEDNDLIRSCGALSSALGLQKSFSTSDVSHLPSPDAGGSRVLRSAVSTLVLDTVQHNGLFLEQARLDNASRSCSTWVAVGDVASTSQLPSPHGGAAQPPPVTSLQSLLPFTAADLVKSVNKKVRQNYIRRRLLTTYRALERLSQSEFNLDRLEAAASAAQNNQGATLAVPRASSIVTNSLLAGVKGKDHVLTIKDIERERGKQLSKYERNMMIFNWLHTLDDASKEEVPPEDVTKQDMLSLPSTCRTKLETKDS